MVNFIIHPLTISCYSNPPKYSVWVQLALQMKFCVVRWNNNVIFLPCTPHPNGPLTIVAKWSLVWFWIRGLNKCTPFMAYTIKHATAMWVTLLRWERFSKQLPYQRWSFPLKKRRRERMKNDAKQQVFTYREWVHICVYSILKPLKTK